MKFNEDSRVKIPACIHLVKLGYKYISKKNNKYDLNTNIFTDIFKKSVLKINKDLTDNDVKKIYDEISILLTSEDLGRSFYRKLISKSKIKLIDFENIDNNEFNIVTELTYKKDEEEFRPDITVLINGLPLSFIEVKKPNNKDGIIAEQKRIQTRFKNKKFRNFINITQLIIYSNNMEYDDSSHLLLQGAFYATTSYKNSPFNYFREEENINYKKILIDISEEDENYILQDNNLISIKNSSEFIKNKKPNTPTNKICTSLLQKKRILKIIKYGFAYVTKKNCIEKHILRYPQFFAINQIEKTLSENQKKGVIWHTQGSGKTALVYFALKYLIDYFSKNNKVVKFYFIVDRIDLLKQAAREFASRNLHVHLINSKLDFSKNIKSSVAIHNDQGKDEITVVNIQKFNDEENIISSNDYNLDIQRIYFLDEVHRSYNPKGSFLANLEESDTNAIKIGLTGTPLLGDENSTRALFGNYIHKYFYNSSIADGYTLRIIREEIENNKKNELSKILENIKIKKGSIERKKLYSDDRFIEPMLDYILNDFKNSRVMLNEPNIGGLVVCDSYEQAENMFKIFNKKVLENNKNFAAKKGGLILYDQGTKQDRDATIEDFKDGNVDILFVYNMLLTGFDSNRLKKLYLGRKIKSHNLLQALTRVNRPYKDLRYGYIVDFADIQKEFDETNKAYFDELQLELGDEIKNYKDMFKSKEEIETEIEDIKNFLFKYETTNLEVFSEQITQINDKNEIIQIVKSLNQAKELYNVIRLTKNYDIINKLDINNISKLYQEANNRLNFINTKIALENKEDVKGLLNLALEDFIFSFEKIKEEELILTDKYRDLLKQTRESLTKNFDTSDIKFISLKEELENLFKKKNLKDVSKNEILNNSEKLTNILASSNKLNFENSLIKTKYDDDEKYAKLHKRIIDMSLLGYNEAKINNIVYGLKTEVDRNITQNVGVLDNESYTEKMISRILIEQIKTKHKIEINLENVKKINNFLIKEYINENNGII